MWRKQCPQCGRFRRWSWSISQVSFSESFNSQKKTSSSRLVIIYEVLKITQPFKWYIIKWEQCFRQNRSLYRAIWKLHWPKSASKWMSKCTCPCSTSLAPYERSYAKGCWSAYQACSIRRNEKHECWRYGGFGKPKIWSLRRGCFYFFALVRTSAFLVKNLYQLKITTVQQNPQKNTLL